MSHIEIQAVPGLVTRQSKYFVHSWPVTRSPLCTVPGTRSQLLSGWPVHPVSGGEETGLHNSISPPRSCQEKPPTNLKYAVNCNSQFHFHSLPKSFGINWSQTKVSNAALTCEFGLRGHLRVLMDQPHTHLCEHTEMSLLMQTLAGFQKKNPQIS